MIHFVQDATSMAIFEARKRLKIVFDFNFFLFERQTHSKGEYRTHQKRPIQPPHD